MPDECSSKKLRVAYLLRIGFSFPLIYHALPIENSVKIPSYYFIYFISIYKLYIYIMIIYIYIYIYIYTHTG